MHAKHPIGPWALALHLEKHAADVVVAGAGDRAEAGGLAFPFPPGRFCFPLRPITVSIR